MVTAFEEDSVEGFKKMIPEENPLMDSEVMARFILLH